MALLCAFPHLSAEEFSSRLPKLWRALEQESVPSTRLFIEWLILLGLLRHRSSRDLASLLARLNEYSQPTGGAISMLTISLHYGLKVDDGELKREYFATIFDRILPWLVHNNHMVRLYSIYVYDRLFVHCMTDGETREMPMPEGYVNVAAFLTRSEHNQRFLSKLRQEYFLEEFDPIRDYTVQTIFSQLPRRVGIASDECISMYSFVNVDGRPTCCIPLGEDPHVAMSSPGALRDEALAEPRRAADANFQQKADPWGTDLMDQDLPELRRQQEQAFRRREFDVIVVASLVDRIPNLAGLSRTCEVFGATTLVLPSLDITKEPAFRNISMTSELWLELLGVAPLQLAEYLEKQRLAGYRIVAVEQSFYSTMLHNYVFPPKCCLVLGSEKEGVPAEILHLVDDCVEIPQFGKIRSLNVHVTGSLILWEARRQRLFHA